MNKVLRIGTRGSKLALWQANWVAARLGERWPDIRFEIHVIKTAGDQIQDRPLDQIPVLGVFTKELDNALLAHEIDLAVHSMKDRPTDTPEGIAIAAIPERADPRDAFIGKQAAHLCDLPLNAVVGTGSLRRQAQALAIRPDLTTTALRGNIDTRLRKLAESDSLGGIILALAGVHRLSLEKHVTEILDLPQWLPAPAQGALAITARTGDVEVAEVVSAIEDADTRAAATSERALLARLGGGCHVPVGAYAQVHAQRISLSGLIADPDGSHVLRDTVEGPIEQAEALGAQLGKILLERGGADIMSALKRMKDEG